MRFELFNIFLNLIDNGSISTTARLMHMTQPSVSAVLASLEKELGQTLIIRSPGQRRPLQPTSAGLIFAKYAQKALNDYQNMCADLIASSGELKKPLRIGVTSSPGSSVLPILSQRFREANKLIQVQIHNFSGTEIFKHLKHNECDIAITGTNPKGKGLIFDRFLYDPLVLICPTSFGIRNSITIKELKSLPLIIRNPSGNLTKLLLQALKSVGVNLEDLNIIMEVYGNNDVLSAVSLGAGAGFIARSLLMVNQENKGITAVPIKRLHVDRYLHLVRCKSTHFTGELRLFWDFALNPGWKEDIFSYDAFY